MSQIIHIVISTMDIEYHLLIISEKETNKKDALNSFSVIYEGFRGFLYNAIKKNIHYKSHKEEFSKTILNEVFCHVWDNPLDWEFKPNTHKSPDAGFKAYIATLAYYKRLEHIRNSAPYLENELSTIDDNNSDWIFNLEIDEYVVLDEVLSKKNNSIDAILVNIDPRKRDIIRMYFLYYEVGKKMSPENIKMMESMFNTTWDNIRQIISRVKRQIKEVANKTTKFQ